MNITYQIFFLGLAIVIVANYIKPVTAFVWGKIRDARSASLMPDSYSRFKITQVKQSSKFMYQLWFSKDNGKRWRQLELCSSKEEAVKYKNMYIDNNKVVDEYDPNVPRLNPGNHDE